VDLIFILALVVLYAVTVWLIAAISRLGRIE
jgi:HAMP domain-containing protein